MPKESAKPAGEEFRVYFVKPPLNEENGSRLVKAYEELERKGYNFKSEWVMADDCLKADGKGKQIYIFDSFEGSAFEHVKKHGYRIYGPLCILGNLLHGLELPKHKKRPIFNLAMKGVKVCCTSIDKATRDEIQKKVHLMNGESDLNLMDDVTHLIAGEVGSSKYLVAVENKKIVMTKGWVDAVWEASQDKHVSATDESFDKYLCPPFLGLTVCVSGFSSGERNKMRGFVLRGGGKYSGELKMNDCTHLVVKEPKGAKYEAAKNWKIRIVKDKWLFESIDKKLYMDPKPYQYNTASSGQKTSTPERRSVIGPNINDVSAISHISNTSMKQVDETRDITSRVSDVFSLAGNQDISETRLGMSCVGDETSRSSSVDVLLDGCKVYLSGVKPASEEKIKRIVTALGALKSSSLDPSISHVIIGDVVPEDVSTLSNFTKCPHVVGIEWLMDCFSNNRHLSEVKYERRDLGLVTPSMRKEMEQKEKAKKGHHDADTTVGKESGAAVADESDKATDSADFRMEAASDLEMAELLSQYSQQQDVTAVQQCNDNNEDTTDQENGRQSHNKTLKAVDHAAEAGPEESMTQDPNDVGEEEEEQEEGKIFTGHTFKTFGFTDDETHELTKLIEERGGRVISDDRQGVDIAVVPLMGFPVEGQATEILTNAWLQMCMERERFIPFEECSFARPITLQADDVLVGCCISVSGFVGVDRDVIMHLCQSMGAKCQEHFARRTNKNVEGSTHLLVQYPTGSKYNAAKKWGIPAVGIEWIFACISSGCCVPEEDFNIDLLEERRLQKLQEKDTAATTTTACDVFGASLPTPARRPEASDARHSTTTPTTSRIATEGTLSNTCVKQGGKTQNDNQNVGNNSAVPDQITPGVIDSENTSTSSNMSKRKGSETNTTTTPLKPDGKSLATPSHGLNREACQSANSTGNESHKVDAHVEHGNQQEDRIPTSSAESSSSKAGVAEEIINPMADIRRHLASTPNSACRPNQSENITAGKLKTPLDHTRQKWAGGSKNVTPNSGMSTPPGLIHGGGETPGTFLQPGFRPKINFDGMFDTSADDSTVDLNKSTPVGEVFRRNLAFAVQHSDEMPQSQTAVAQPRELPPLHGVVIAVAKKLGRNHEMYNTIVVELGGDYSWQNGAHVTHFVFQGRPNDPNKEFRKAREDGKVIVSPHWLTACKEQQCRVDESMFPHSFNPSCSLTLTPARRGVTPRSTRSGISRGKQTGDSQSMGSAAVTPLAKAGRKAPVLNLQQVEMEAQDKTGSKWNTPKLTTKENDVEMQDKTSSKSNTPKQTTKESKNSLETPVEEDKRENSTTPATPEKSASPQNAADESADRSKNQEMKEALSNALGNVLAESSRSKRSTRRKGKLMNLSGQMSTPEVSLVENNTASSWGSKNKESRQTAAAVEPSQSLQVTWDDPTERLEKEKLAHRLETVCEPSQSTEEMAGMDVPDRHHSVGRGGGQLGDSRFPERSPTPEPPPLVFPITRPARNVESPQPVELISEESSDSRHENCSKQQPVFLISGMSNEERLDYSALVEQLGGRMIETQHFDPCATHLVVGQPARNEKYLSCIASGKWVLHKSFFEASRKEGKFVGEEQHEWGSEYTASLTLNMSGLINELAAAAYKWRRKVAAIREAKPSCQGAFDGWRVLLCMPKNKEDNFCRLLQAGGATVTSIKSPLSDTVKGTHAFLDLAKVPMQQEDLVKLIEADVHCLQASYIPAYLTNEPVPDPSEFYPAEVISLRACIGEPNPQKKRSSSSTDKSSSSSKRSRRR